MVAAVQQPGPSRRERTFSPVKFYRGEVVYIYAYDVAYDVSREPVRSLLGQPVEQFHVDQGKRAPRPKQAVYQPQMVRLPPVTRMGPRGPVQIEWVIKLLPVGAVSISVRVPFEVRRIQELVAYHDLRFLDGSISEEARELAERVRKELAGFFIRPVPHLVDEEAYTVFCIESPLCTGDQSRLSAEEWFRMHRRELAALLTQESDVTHLSEQEANESTSRYLSYYQDDLVVVDWDAAILVDQREEFEEALYIMELANIQLTELEAYDRMLDEALERSYRDLRVRRRRGRSEMLDELREMRIDFARLSDELSNITKFFGDWHLARLYEAVSSRFHLPDWHKTIEEKLKTLDSMYQMLKHDQATRWMLILEAAIVVLFIIDLAILLSGSH